MPKHECPRHGFTDFTEPNDNHFSTCEKCLEEEELEKKLPKYVALGRAAYTIVGIGYSVNYRGFKCEIWDSGPDGEAGQMNIEYLRYIEEKDGTVSEYLAKHRPLNALLDRLTSSHWFSIKKIEIQDEYLFIHQDNEQVLLYKLVEKETCSDV